MLIVLNFEQQMEEISTSRKAGEEMTTWQSPSVLRGQRADTPSNVQKSRVLIFLVLWPWCPGFSYDHFTPGEEI